MRLDDRFLSGIMQAQFHVFWECICLSRSMTLFGLTFPHLVVQAAVQRFETLAGRSAMVSLFRWLQIDCLMPEATGQDAVPAFTRAVSQLTRICLLMQIGFVVALLAEVNVPAEGLFGAWDGHTLSVFGASASFLIACAAVRVSCPWSAPRRLLAP